LNRKEKAVFKIPGEKIAVIEEFMAGPGTFIEEGDIRSKTVGYTITDFHNKLVSIYSGNKNPVFPRKGSIVLGQVVSTQDKTAIIRILSVDRQLVPGQLTGVIHISTVSSDYVRTMYDATRLGDLIKAKVISNRNGVTHLSTIGREFGVIQAFCSRCGEKLTRRGRILSCPVCSNNEERKITTDYEKELGELYT
jgi:exosome complex component CSL4